MHKEIQESMSAPGYTYITEECHDAFAVELDNVFGKDKWTLSCPQHYNQVWALNEYGNSVKVEIYDQFYEELIGCATIYNDFYIGEESHSGKGLAVRPDYIEIYKGDSDLKTDVRPVVTTAIITIKVKIEHNGEIAAGTAIELVGQEMDYHLKYSTDVVRITDTEITEVRRSD